MSIPLWDLAAGTATDLLAGLRARGVVLYVEGDRLRWRALRGAMSVELLKRIKALEPELIAHLGALQDAEGEGD